MEILAHRGNQDGPSPSTENTQAAVRACLARGWGLETDIRRSADGAFYIAHDRTARTPANAAEVFSALWRQCPKATIALNIKELGYEKELVEFLLRENLLSHVFLFDMEFIEPKAGSTAALFRRLCAPLRLAVRVSDHHESIDHAIQARECDVVWADEFEQLWLQASDIRRLKEAGKTIYAISPELHGFSLDVMRSRWTDFGAWGIDGICTDYPQELERQLIEAAPKGIENAHH
jgi:hypothetical protein